MESKIYSREEIEAMVDARYLGVEQCVAAIRQLLQQNQELQAKVDGVVAILSKDAFDEDKVERLTSPRRRWQVTITTRFDIGQEVWVSFYNDSPPVSGFVFAITEAENEEREYSIRDGKRRFLCKRVESFVYASNRLDALEGD